MKIIWPGILLVVYFYFIVTQPPRAPEAQLVQVAREERNLTSPKEQMPTPVVEEVTVSEQEVVDLEKGKTIYLAQCIKCHNKDPNLKGSIGPEVVDAPIEVMRAKVATGRYPDPLPEGFIPKRKTKQMTKFPQYLKDVPSIYAYVQSLKKK